MDMSKLGQNLRRIRLKKGLSQSDVADLINTSTMAISKFENCKSFPSIRTFIFLCKGLKIKPNKLLEGFFYD